MKSKLRSHLNVPKPAGLISRDDSVNNIRYSRITSSKTRDDCKINSVCFYETNTKRMTLIGVSFRIFATMMRGKCKSSGSKLLQKILMKCFLSINFFFVSNIDYKTEFRLKCIILCYTYLVKVFSLCLTSTSLRLFFSCIIVDE